MCVATLIKKIAAVEKCDISMNSWRFIKIFEVLLEFMPNLFPTHDDNGYYEPEVDEMNRVEVSQ